jgi:broad specificity phosphatase PhoE
VSYLFFVRHGQGTLDGGHYDQLSELGRVQSRMLGEAWAARDFKIDYVYSGTQKRHRQTAETVAVSYETNGLKFPEIIKDERFNEIDSLDVLEKLLAGLLKKDPEFYALVEKTRIALKENSPDKIDLFDRCMKTIMDAWINERIPGFDGMSWKEYCRLVLDARSELGKYDAGDRIAIFTSGNPIGIYVKEALGISDAKALELVGNLYNTNVTSIILKDGTLSLSGMNDVSHLRDGQVTQK